MTEQGGDPKPTPAGSGWVVFRGKNGRQPAVNPEFDRFENLLRKLVATKKTGDALETGPALQRANQAPDVGPAVLPEETP